MRASSTIRASLLALAVLTLTAGSALAGGGGTRIGTAPGTTEADCIKSGGTVTVDANGHKICKPAKSGADTREPSN